MPLSGHVLDALIYKFMWALAIPAVLIGLPMAVYVGKSMLSRQDEKKEEKKLAEEYEEYVKSAGRNKKNDDE
jgi:hypothetical protein